MLTDEHIEQEAARRLAAMLTTERMAKEAGIRSGVRLAEQVAREGYKTLSKQDRMAYHTYSQDCIRSGGGGDYQLRQIEAQMKEGLDLSREQIASLKKNPFLGTALRALLIAAIVGIGGVLVTALIEKYSGLDMKYVYIGFSSVSGLLALGFADQLLKVFRFKKLQKAYEDPAFQEQEIEAAMFRQLNESVKRDMDIQRYGVEDVLEKDKRGRA